MLIIALDIRGILLEIYVFNFLFFFVCVFFPKFISFARLPDGRETNNNAFIGYCVNYMT